MGQHAETEPPWAPIVGPNANTAMPTPAMDEPVRPLVGRPVERVEDAALLCGRGRFADDLGVRRDTLHAAVLRSPHAHAEIVSVDAEAALTLPGVLAVLTREDVRRWSRPFMTAIRLAAEQWCLAVDRVRYVGEPVAIAIAESRYLAEDALERLRVTYRPLPAIVDPEGALAADAPRLHAGLDGNLVSERRFRYGDSETAFAAAAHEVGITVRYPRNACTPIEGYVVVAEYDPGTDSYDVLANFQGPYSLHPVMARALGVPGNRLRLRTPPDSGGSFGVKQAIFPYVVGVCLAARKAGRPVKWVEDRLEHLMAATSATNRVTTIEAAVAEDGEILALRVDQLEDCGAYLRAPEPASLYRMHSVLTGAYKVANLEVVNRIVLTNKTPTGLNRGFGGPQTYFALERLTQRISVELGLDPLDVIRRNLIPAEAFPYRTPSGGLLDSGNYLATVETAVVEGNLDALRERCHKARAEGRLYGIGFAAVVEPSISNMGYVTSALTPEERQRAGPKDGASAAATVAIDPVGAVSVSVDSIPQGQGHRTVVAQVVGDVLGLGIEDIQVDAEHDTRKDAWSIAAGNYSSRFAGAVAGTVHLAALRLADRLRSIAEQQLNVPAEGLEFGGGRIYARDNPDNALPLGRVAGQAHWSPGSLPEGVGPGLRETVFWTMPELTAPDAEDRVNGSGTYGFILDFCGVEIDPDTGSVQIDRYVSTHDAGRLLNPALVDGQIHGGFAHAVGAALYEEFVYGEDGSFLSGTFADYRVPTCCEVPDPIVIHVESPSPFTPLGAKGVGEGNCMSTPVCIANAVADALGIADLTLPLTPPRVAELIHGEERPRGPESTVQSTAPPAAQEPATAAPASGSRALNGEGATTVPIDPEALWRLILDPEALAAVIPGCRELEAVGENRYRAEINMGVGPVKGDFSIEVGLRDLDRPRSLTLEGRAVGPLGAAGGSGQVSLEAVADGTRVSYRYRVEIGGKVAAVGGRMLQGATRMLIGQFFERLVLLATGKPAAKPSFWRRLLRWLGVSR